MNLYILRNRHRRLTRFSLDTRKVVSRYQVTDHAGFGSDKGKTFLSNAGRFACQCYLEARMLSHLTKWSVSFL